MHLIVDNTRPIDPTLPDRLEPIDRLEVSPVFALAFILGGFAYRIVRLLPWIALGVVIGLFVI
jgi:hypothetical protein